MLFLLVAAELAAGPTASAAPPPASINPHATELFERDPELSAWAVRIFDSNHDGWLTSFEAQAALDAFREIADVDHDGRVTVREYVEAKRFIGARWALSR